MEILEELTFNLNSNTMNGWQTGKNTSGIYLSIDTNLYGYLLEHNSEQHDILNVIYKKVRKEALAHVKSYAKSKGCVFCTTKSYHRTQVDESSVKWKKNTSSTRTRQLTPIYLSLVSGTRKACLGIINPQPRNIGPGGAVYISPTTPDTLVIHVGAKGKAYEKYMAEKDITKTDRTIKTLTDSIGSHLDRSANHFLQLNKVLEEKNALVEKLDKLQST